MTSKISASRRSRDPHDERDRLAREVVLSRPEAAADDDRFIPVERGVESRGDAPDVVADPGLKIAVDARQGELLANPGGVACR